MAEILTENMKAAMEAEKPVVVEEPKETPAVAAPAAGEEQTGEEVLDPPKKKGGFVRRIERLETENELLSHQNRELMERLAGKPADGAPKPADGAKPKLDDFKTYEDYVEALTDWKVEQKTAQLTESHAQETAELTYIEQAAESKKAHEDWDEVFDEANDIPIHPEVKGTILELDNGAEVAYYLAKNPETAIALQGMSLRRAVAEIGRIAALVEKKTEAPAEVKPRSNTPAPITPVSGGAATATPDPNKMSVAEWRKHREAMAS